MSEGETTRRKPPLYRKVNTRARGVHHQAGGDFRHERAKEKMREAGRGTMHGRQKRGLDYTPLFQFLLSKVGREWDPVLREAVSRLDKPDPIFWLVALTDKDRQEYVRVGESSYFSGLFVDQNGRLQLVNPKLGAAMLAPSCACCTHTLNGIPFTRKYESR